jgi:anti-sigma regulatory factor (Ser/Thr protein kinase)
MEPVDGEPKELAVGYLPVSGETRRLGRRIVPARPEEVAPTRHWLTQLLAADHAKIVDDVVLLACEAVTNAIRHSDSAKIGGTVTVAVMELAGMIRVEVTDAGSATNVPRLKNDDPEALNGRGLHLLDFVSGGCWGSCTDGGDRTVWFEIAVDERATPLGEP